MTGNRCWPWHESVFFLRRAAGQGGSAVQLSGLGAAVKEAVTALVPRSVAIPITVAEVWACTRLSRCPAGCPARQERTQNRLSAQTVALILLVDATNKERTGNVMAQPHGMVCHRIQ